MDKGRLEAFSDGVIAILITIMVLELTVPNGKDLAALRPLLPKFLSYILSFVFLAIYWNNHHHLWQAAERVNGAVLWTNMHLLFWLSLIPFVTAWMGENNFASTPVVMYGLVLWLAAFAYYLMVRALISLHGMESLIALAIRSGNKEKWSLFIYTSAIIVGFFIPRLSVSLYTVVAVMWLIPDRRIEDKILQSK